MTGIERLREFVAGVSPFTVVCGVTRATYDEEHTEVFGARLRDFLSEIADQIEREQVEHAGPYDYRRIRMEWAIRGVLRDMERHVLGHESMENSPVARWARELRGALGGRDEEEVTDVATIRKDAYDAYEWVCEHGGLDYVIHEWRSRVPRDRMAWKAHELFMAGETAQDVARALNISVSAVYKAVALVARNPRPFRERFERYQRELEERGRA